MFTELLRTLQANEPADARRVEEALHAILLGEADAERTAELLVALATRPPSASVLAAAARALRAHRVAVYAEVRPLIDTCGTGGDGAGTFNISTAAAFVVAAAGAAVAKHGNRAASSRVGSADVLEAAGCALAVDATAAGKLLDAVGFAFLFAPAFHPALARVAPVRKRLGIPTIFNLLGPLANPASADVQLVGVYDPALTAVLCEALRELGCRSALVVHGAGLDEIALHATTTAHRLRDGRVEAIRIEPEEAGLSRTPLEELRGATDAMGNAALLRETLEGAPGPRGDVVAMNAGAALWIAERTPSLRAGVHAARELLRSGEGWRVLVRYAASSQRAARTEPRT